MTKQIDKEDARQGETGKGVRYVLFGSVTLTVIVLALLWIFVA